MANQKTNVAGYFNPNDYPLQIVVSEHNLTINLDTKQYVVDRAGRLVNDPVLDKYVGKGRLSRATNPKQQSEVVRLVAVNNVAPTGQPATQYTHPVYEATGFVRDQHGKMAPVAVTSTAPTPTVQPPVSYNPVKAMSIKDARRLKLIRPTKASSEDSGVPDTTGVPIPGEKTPEIQYQTDEVVQRPKPLPEAIAQPVNAAQAQLIQGLQAAQAIDPENPQVLDIVSDAVKRLPDNLAPIVQPPPPTPSSIVLKSKAPPIPKNPQPTPIVSNVLPEPNLDELTVEEELPVVSVPKPPVDDEPLPVVEAKVEKQYKCPICPTKAFNAPGYLKRHIKTDHADQSNQLLQRAGLL